MLPEEEEEQEEEEEGDEDQLKEEGRKTSTKHKRDVFRDLSSIVSSVFSDAGCGEPTQAQHLVIDFTHIEGVDTEHDRDKCFEFWKLVDKEPLLQAFIVDPVLEDDMLSGEIEAEEEKEKEVYVEPKKTAISVLNQATDELECTNLRFGNCKSSCLCNERRLTPPEYSRPALRKLCRQLDEWTSNNPKSFKPPGHPPDPGPSLHDLGTGL